MRRAGHEAVESEEAQVVGHLAGAVGRFEESGDEPAKAGVGEPVTAWIWQHEAPVRAMARGSPKRRAPVLRPSHM